MSLAERELTITPRPSISRNNSAATVSDPSFAEKVKRHFDWAAGRILPVTEYCYDWDTHAGLPVDRSAVALAAIHLSFLRYNFPSLSAPEVLPEPNGGVYMGWEGDHYQLMIQVFPDGSANFGYIGDNGHRRSQHYQISDELPVSLSMSLRLIT
ncbi:MAG: hypothetical protein JSS83_17465 [Cyanobacteria bacterium SZAS LIN-3]|nr:hypothetical protein [Cyanobacteria bacterium SZAS LIN-3]